ncbi:GNAT family N-acetyltransferase [Brevibacterium sp. JNUCC-42]|nr:GNAT family N-acetyltransferase [Brevibacterium sp. JNUCC-42]
MITDYPVLVTKRLMLLHLSLHQADDLFEIFSKEETTHHVPRKIHKTKLDTVLYLEKRMADCAEKKAFIWAIYHRESGKIIGVAGLFQYAYKEKSASLGAVLHPDYRGKGMTYESLRAVMAYGFKEIGLVRMEGKCEATNTLSERVMQRLGMVYEGTLRKNVLIKGELRDSKVYSVLQEEYMEDENASSAHNSLT